MLDNSLQLFMELIWTQGFLSVKTVRSGVIQHLAVTLMSPDVPSAMELMIPNTTERKRGVVWKTRKWIEQLPMLVSYILISSNVWIARETIKQIAIAVLIGTTGSTKSGTVENNKNSFESRVQ